MIRACDGLTSMMSYWTFSDVFEEQGVVRTPFYGGFGLIAERGIPKAAFRAFELLHQLGDKRFESSGDDRLLTKKADGTLIAAIWNYAEPGRLLVSSQMPPATRHGISDPIRLAPQELALVTIGP